jgi:hypothetical protein
MKGCAIRRSHGIAVLNVGSLVIKLPWPSDHVCNSGTWKIPMRPGALQQSFQCGPVRPAKFPERNHNGFFSINSQKYPVFLEKNPVSLLFVKYIHVRTCITSTYLHWPAYFVFGIMPCRFLLHCDTCKIFQIRILLPSASRYILSSRVSRLYKPPCQGVGDS